MSAEGSGTRRPQKRQFGAMGRESNPAHRLQPGKRRGDSSAFVGKRLQSGIDCPKTSGGYRACNRHLSANPIAIGPLSANGLYRGVSERKGGSLLQDPLPTGSESGVPRTFDPNDLTMKDLSPAPTTLVMNERRYLSPKRPYNYIS